MSNVDSGQSNASLNAGLRQPARVDQAKKERQVTLRFTAAKLGGGVEGDVVAEALGQRIIDAILRYWDNQIPVKTIIRKVNGSLSPAEALSIIDIYAILFVALGKGLIKDNNSSGDMGIMHFSEVFKAWKHGHERAVLYRLFPKVGSAQIDRCVRACQRRVESQLQQERDNDIANAEPSPEASEFMSRIRALNLSPELFKQLHTDDANAVRYGKFMVVDGRPAFVLFLGEKQDAHISSQSVTIRPTDIRQPIRSRFSFEQHGSDGSEPEVAEAGEQEAERMEKSQEEGQAVKEEAVPDNGSEEEDQDRVQQFDQPQLSKPETPAIRPMTLTQQAEQIKQLTSRGKNPEIVDHAREFQFTGLTDEQKALLAGSADSPKTLPRKETDASNPQK